MLETLIIVNAILTAGVLALVLAGLLRGAREAAEAGQVAGHLDSLARRQEQAERAAADHADRLRHTLTTESQALRQEVATQMQAFGEASNRSVATLAQQVGQRLGDVALQIESLTRASEERLERVRAVVDERLRQLQEDNARRLDQMRATVDEKLQATLELRLGESFRQVSERLEQVHRGLGEMQALSAGVDELKRLMGNVKARGTWAEYQLRALLEDILTPDQFCANFRPNPQSGRVVEYAVRMPGTGQDGEAAVYLPIDSKFPRQAWEQLVMAAEAGDPDTVQRCAEELERAVRQWAREIRDKYIAPPVTTDWAIMYVPTEGLYAEIVRRPGLLEALVREYRVAVVGPVTLGAYLNALCLGFRAAAIQQRSREVFEVLTEVKKRFEDFGATLRAVDAKLDEATRKLREATDRHTRLGRSLERVQTLRLNNRTEPPALPDGGSPPAPPAPDTPDS